MNSTIQAFTVLIMLGLLISCTAREGEPTTERTVIDVRAIYDAENDKHLFKTETDTVPAGWTTFRFTNASPMVHFVFLDHLPGERTSEELLDEVSPIFQESADLIEEGKPEEGMAVFSKLPDWFTGLVFRGGPGYTSPGKSIETTLFLAPGNYVIECYVKNADGVYHWNLGMYKDLHVTSDTTDAQPPSDPTIEITVYGDSLDVQGEPTPGRHLVAVHYQEEDPGLIGNDVHVVQLDQGGTIEDVVKWMDFTSPGSLISTAEDPGPAPFLGGAHEMPKGNTAYFTLELEPGRYAWISEQPADRRLYRVFTVSGEGTAN